MPRRPALRAALGPQPQADPRHALAARPPARPGGGAHRQARAGAERPRGGALRRSGRQRDPAPGLQPRRRPARDPDPAAGLPGRWPSATSTPPMSAVRERTPPAGTPLSARPPAGRAGARGLGASPWARCWRWRSRLRLWGVKQGLPYAYNIDENAHFVPEAIGLFGHGGNPHYFVNPPAFTYLLHAVFAVWLRRRATASSRRLRDRSRPRSSWWPGWRRRRWGPPRSGCSTWPGRACSTGASGCWRRRSWRSPSCPSSTRTWRSTTCPRCARLPGAGGRRPGCCAAARCATTLLAGRRARARGARPSTRPGSSLLPLLRRGGRAARARGAGRCAAARAGRRRRAGRIRGRQPYALLDHQRVPRRACATSPSASGEAAGKLGAHPGQRRSSTTCGR